MNVRLNFLGNVGQQQASLMNTIALIGSNPNITADQAQNATLTAINEFNTFLKQYGTYSASMMPASNTGTSSGTYNNSNYSYKHVDSGSWPALPATG